MRRARALLLDLDETLLVRAHQPAVEGTCEQIAAMRPSLDAGRLTDANTREWRLYWREAEHAWALGELSGAAVSLEAWRRTLRACGHEDESLAQLAARTHQQLALAAHRLFDDVPDLLASAARARVPLGLVTNGASDTQRGKLHAMDLEHCFDAIVISGEIGVVKPDPAVFEVALSGLGLGRDDVWHVGDSPGTDVAGARAAGLKAVWINRSGRPPGEGEPEPHMEIRSLDELAPLLGGSPAP